MRIVSLMQVYWEASFYGVPCPRQGYFYGYSTLSFYPEVCDKCIKVGWSKVAKVWAKKFQKTLQQQYLNHISDAGNGFSTIKNLWAPKILKFDSYNMDLQKSLPDFIKILLEFP